MAKTKQVEFNEEVYAEAEHLRGLSAESLRLMALYAWDHRTDKEALRACSMAYERSASRMAAAVVRWPSWFMVTDGMPPLATSVDDCLSLFAIAGLPREEGERLFRKWRDHTWSYWQVREHIDRLQDGKAQVIRLHVSRVKVLDCNSHNLRLGIASGYGLTEESMLQWQGKEAKLTLEQIPPTPEGEKKEGEDGSL